MRRGVCLLYYICTRTHREDHREDRRQDAEIVEIDQSQFKIN